MNTVKVHVAAGEGVEDARRAVKDVLELLNRHFRSKGVEFVAAGEGAGDWAIALWWKEFGEMGRAEFEKVYEGFRKEKKPVIHVFFKEPDEGIAETLKAFKDAFAEKYGHFYCRFETVDAVKFQLAAQSLSMLPGAEAKEEIKVAGGEIRLGGETVAKLSNLPFAKLNARRQSLLRRIDDAEEEVAALEEQSEEEPEDEDLRESLRAARVNRHGLKKELAQYDGFLCDTAVFFAKESAKELDERVRKARELFDRGQITEANRLLDLSEMVRRDRRDAEVFMQARTARIRNIQAFAAKAKLVMADASLKMRRRAEIADKAYGHAIRIAREIRWEEGKLGDYVHEHARLLHDQNRFRKSLQLYEEGLRIRRRLVQADSAANEADLAMALNNLAVLHSDLQRRRKAEEEYREALGIYRQLAEAVPGIHESDVALTLNNLAALHAETGRLGTAEAEYSEALSIWRDGTYRETERGAAQGAVILNNLGNLHGGTQRQREAEREYGEALEIYRRLAEGHPEEYAPHVANTLCNLGILHGEGGRWQAAETELEEALGIRRRLAEDNPEAHEPDVAAALNNLANLHVDTQRPDVAAEEYREALGIYRRLAEENPDAYGPDIVRTLNNLAILHRAAGRLREAERTYGEALDTLRGFPEDDPEGWPVFEAILLTNLSNLLRDAQRWKKAERACRKALAIWRRIAKACPAAHEADVATALNDLANLHSDTQRLDEAEKEYGAALAIYRRLAEVHPEAHDADVALVLHNLGILRKKAGKDDAAEEAYREALGIRRRLASGTPSVHGASVARTLNSLAILHKDTQREGEAEAEYTEAVGIWQVLAERNPSEYGGEWAMTLYNLASLHDWMSRNPAEEWRAKRRIQAEAEYAAALAIWRRRAEAPGEEGETEPEEVAMALIGLAGVHFAMSRADAAEKEYRDAAEIMRRLAEKWPTVYDGGLGEALCGWAACLALQGRREEASGLAKAGLAAIERCGGWDGGMATGLAREAEALASRADGE